MKHVDAEIIGTRIGRIDSDSKMTLDILKVKNIQGTSGDDVIEIIATYEPPKYIDEDSWDDTEAADYVDDLENLGNVSVSDPSDDPPISKGLYGKTITVKAKPSLDNNARFEDPNDTNSGLDDVKVIAEATPAIKANSLMTRPHEYKLMVNGVQVDTWSGTDYDFINIDSNLGDDDVAYHWSISLYSRLTVRLGGGDDKCMSLHYKEYYYGNHIGDPENYCNNQGDELKAVIVEGSLGADTIKGACGNDVISGGDGNDDINVGSHGDDTVEAGSDDDMVYGSGNDVVDCGPGNDTFSFQIVSILDTSNISNCENMNGI